MGASLQSPGARLTEHLNNAPSYFKGVLGA